MAGLGQRFDATAHDTEQRGEYEELPNGVYDLEVTESDVVPTKNGSGTILKTTNRVVAPAEYEGRLLFNNYNLENANAQAQEIGQRQFASLCRAIGVTEVEDSEELHFKTFRVKIKLGKPSKDGQYPARAEIGRYYFADEGDIPDVGIDASQPAKTPAPANDNRRPAANDNRPAAGAGEKKPRPWGNK